MKTPYFKQLVLVGGGHAHALLIRMWGMKPLPGVQLVLVSPSWRTPYSGMLPGLLAGHYSHDDIHIDLRKLCRWAGVRFIESQATGIDTEQKSVQLSDRADLEYDMLSLDIGSIPQSLPTSDERVQTVKPISAFVPRFEQLLASCRASGAQKIAVVGGGAGGIEVTLALAERLKREGLSAELSLIIRDQKVLTNYPLRVSQAATRALDEASIKLHTGLAVTQFSEGKLYSNKTELGAFDQVFFCTEARAAGWLAESGLDCDERGFVRVNRHLQSLSHSDIFAAGDVAAMVESPRPKAGVYAVRQAPVLYRNLRRALLGRSLLVFKPQTSFLSLLSLGGRRALASKHGFALTQKPLQGALWRWKDRIDRRFMAMFAELPTMAMSAPEPVDSALLAGEEAVEKINPQMRCAGCGGKVGTDILAQALMQINGDQPFAPEDAATVHMHSTSFIQSVDQIRAPIDDPYLFGRIATLHALSDIFAMGAEPASAQLLLNLPYAGAMQQTREMIALMRGVSEELNRHRCQLLGGHTAEAQELSLGLVVNGEYNSVNKPLAKGGIQAGDQLILTKPLGTGVILAAHMPGTEVQASGASVNAALDSMLTSNAEAARILRDCGANACTDVTGFGLAGHLIEMLRASGAQARLELARVPLLKGALELSRQGVKSSLYGQNYKAIKALSLNAETLTDERFALLFDPQTSGGLLAAIPAEQVPTLQQSGLEFWLLGEVTGSCGEWDLQVH